MAVADTNRPQHTLNASGCQQEDGMQALYLRELLRTKNAFKCIPNQINAAKCKTHAKVKTQT